MGPPLLIGAGLGAITSAAMGKNPLTGALMGGALGGLGGAGGLFGGAGAGGAGAAATGAAENGLLSTAAATEGAANAGNIGMFNTFNTGAGSALGSAGTYAQGLNPTLYTGSQGMFDVAKGSTLGYNPTFLGGEGAASAAGGGGYDPSLLGRVQEAGSNAFSGVKNMFNGMSTKDKLGLGVQGYQALNQPTQPIQAHQGQIKQGNPDMVATAPVFASPTIGLSPEERANQKLGQVTSMARVSDADKRKIQDFYDSYIG